MYIIAGFFLHFSTGVIYGVFLTRCTGNTEVATFDGIMMKFFLSFFSFGFLYINGWTGFTLDGLASHVRTVLSSFSSPSCWNILPCKWFGECFDDDDEDFPYVLTTCRVGLCITTTPVVVIYNDSVNLTGRGTVSSFGIIVHY